VPDTETITWERAGTFGMSVYYNGSTIWGLG